MKQQNVKCKQILFLSMCTLFVHCLTNSCYVDSCFYNGLTFILTLVQLSFCENLASKSQISIGELPLTVKTKVKVQIQ